MPAFGRKAPDRLDFYMLRLLAAPLGFVLGTVLIAQLLDRLLRLLDLAAASGAPLTAVLGMAAHLVPHYLGLALPAAFTVAMFLALARLSDDSELDVILGAGRSIVRLAMPYFAVAAALGAVSVYLFGHLQPLSRYAYRAAVHDAVHTRWDARVEENRFVSAGRGFVLSADEVGADGRRLRGVFVQRRTEVAEEITTAPQGRLVPTAEGRLVLELDDGLTVREDNEGVVSLMRFVTSVVNADFTPGPPAFRPRGSSVRELTLGELWQSLRSGHATLPRQRLAGEFHGRLARSAALPLLPLLAVPLGIAAKRGRRAAGAVFAALALLALNHALQFGESLAESGRADALVAVWTPLALFAAAAFWLFRSSLAWPGDNPISRATASLGEALGRLRRPLLRTRP
ncbi:MAG TPA: LptF/LptG family permease [Burkholderiales bacterium]|nr:LptF/LptG family permease [Burkholderiales bacterium]